jgi:hypothetical protein
MLSPELGKGREFPQPRNAAREVALLVEEAIALILIHGDRSYAEIAAQAAK